MPYFLFALFGINLNKKIALADERRIGMRQGIKKGKLEGLKEGKLEGRKEGRLAEQVSMAKTMKNKNMDINLISEITGLTLEEIRKLRPDGEKL